MVGAKRSKKSKSKRQTLKQKYKVLKKVREHHRKKRREEKKLGGKKKEPKDPGIPKAWPFKEELVAQLKAQKEAHDMREKRLREERRKQKELEAAGGMEHDAGGGQELAMQSMQQAAAKRAGEYERSAKDDSGSAFTDYSRRAFFKEFVKVVESSDVIIEVLDARDPLGCRCLDVERFVRRTDPSKKIVLLLNKIDLVPREVAARWLKYLREELPAVAFKCSTQKQGANLGQRKLAAAADAALKGSECLGADTLLQLLKNYARNLNLKTAITVGVVGLPNVGKSSLINSLKRSRVTQVGNTPGVTKAVQEVHLDKQVTLLDSPGVVFTTAGADGEAAAALRNCVKVEQLSDPVLPVSEIVRRCPSRQLMALYKVAAFSGAEQFLQHVAQARGKLRKGGTVDMQAAARIVLQDWNDGRIPYYTLPPQRKTEVEGSATLVAQWGQEFNVQEVYQAQESAVIAGLPSLNDPSAAFFQTETAGEAHTDLVAMAAQQQQQGDGNAGSMSESEGEEGGPSSSEVEEMDEGDRPPPAKRQARGNAAKQNVQLYGQEGQFNPKAAKAERKLQKKEQRAAGGGSGQGSQGSDSDYDFEEDWGAVTTGNAFEHIADAATSEEDEGEEDLE